MVLINKRMTRDEMFKLYPNQWIAYGDADEDENGFFSDRYSDNGCYTALLIAICNSQKEAILVPFEGDDYKVTGMGVINSIWWEESYCEDFFLYDITEPE